MPPCKNTRKTLLRGWRRTDDIEDERLIINPEGSSSKDGMASLSEMKDGHRRITSGQPVKASKLNVRHQPQQLIIQRQLQSVN
jgi:hypothetical protein